MRTNVGILDFLSGISIQDLAEKKLVPGEANFFTSLDGRVGMYGNIGFVQSNAISFI